MLSSLKQNNGMARKGPPKAYNQKNCHKTDIFINEETVFGLFFLPWAIEFLFNGKTSNLEISETLKILVP